MKALTLNTALALLLTLVPLAQAGFAFESEPTGAILDVQGPVSWHLSGVGQFQAAQGGESLQAGAVVRTGMRGFAHIHWRNGGDFKLYPLSELVVPQNEGVDLNAGAIWAVFSHKLLKPFYFQSPTATAVVRGTTLGVEIQPGGATHVAVIEGHVEVSGLHGRVPLMLAPGEAVTITPFGLLGPVGPVTPGDRNFDYQPPNDSKGPPPQERQAPPPPRPGFGWLRQFRAQDRLEQVREQGSRPEWPQRAPREGGGDAHFSHSGQRGDRQNNPVFGAPDAPDSDQGLPDGAAPNQDNSPGLPLQLLCPPSAGPVCLPPPMNHPPGGQQPPPLLRGAARP
jgi:hypothetical protein